MPNDDSQECPANDKVMAIIIETKLAGSRYFVPRKKFS
jgi:hypothetical protein